MEAAADYEQQLLNKQNEKPKVQRDDLEGEFDEEDEFAQDDYEQQLLSKQNNKSKAHQNRDSSFQDDKGNTITASQERKEYEKQILEDHNKKQKLTRTGEEDDLKGIKNKPSESSPKISKKKSKVHPPASSQPKPEEDKKEMRDKELKLIKQKQLQKKKQEELQKQQDNAESSEEPDSPIKFIEEVSEVKGSQALPKNAAEDMNNSRSRVNKPQGRHPDKENDYRRDFQPTGHFSRQDFEDDEEEHRNRKGFDRRQDQFGHPMYPPYTVYAPPIYPAPMYQVAPNMYGSAYSPNPGFQTPQFHLNDPNIATSENKNMQFSPVEVVEKKLVFDVGTSPEDIENQVRQELAQEFVQEHDVDGLHSSNHMQNVPIQQLIPPYPMEHPAADIQGTSQSPKRTININESQSFAASPSDKYGQNRSSILMLDPVTRAWVDALSFLDSEDYQSAYEIILSTGDDIYLLRLVSHTGPVIKYLHPKTAAQVIKKMNQIVRCNIFPVFTTDWIEESQKSGVFKTFNSKDQNEYLDTLDLFSQDKSDSELAEKASKIYANIIEDDEESR